MASDGEIVYMEFVDRDQIYNFVVKNIFIWNHYGHQMGHIRHLKVMLKEKYLISSHMWWCIPVVGTSMCEVNVTGLNPPNATYP